MSLLAKKLLKAGGESFDSYTSAIYHFDTDLNDSSDFANHLTAVGDAAATSTDPKFGTGSLELDGTTDSGTLAATLPTELLFRTGDWTVDYWVNFSSVVANKGIFEIGTFSSGIYVRMVSSSTINIYINGASQTISWTPSTGTWYHHEWSRSGTTVKFFVDGTQTGTFTNSADINPTSEMRIGGIESGNHTHNGYLDEFRISKGIARHTSNFTPETGPYG